MIEKYSGGGCRCLSVLYTTERGKSQLTLKREKVVVISRPPIVNRTTRESHLFSHRICELKVKLNPSVYTRTQAWKLYCRCTAATTTKYNNPPRASVVRIYIFFFYHKRTKSHERATTDYVFASSVCTNIYLLIIYAKAPPRTDVPPFRTVAHKSLSALAKDSPGNLYARYGGVAFETETHRYIYVERKIALSWAATARGRKRRQRPDRV